MSVCVCVCVCVQENYVSVCVCSVDSQLLDSFSLLGDNSEDDV